MGKRESAPRVVVHRGEGIVSRRGTFVVVAAPDTPTAVRDLEHFLGAAGAPAADDLLRLLDELAPPCIVAVADVQATGVVTTARRIDDSWTIRQATDEAVLIGRRGASSGLASELLDLRDGSVPGCGALIAPAGTTVFGASAGQDEPTAASSFVLIDLAAAPEEEARAHGRLVRDDGVVYEITAVVVLGRDPSLDRSVREGRATGIAVDDAERTVSRVHARIESRPDGVWVQDAGSANGTFVRRRRERRWRPVNDDEPQRLVSGMRIKVGERTFAYVG